MKKILAIATDGFEEIELAAPLDLLHRAGAKITLATVCANENLLIKGRSDFSVKADSALETLAPSPAEFEKLADDFDALFLPGGPGTWKLLEDGRAPKIATAFAKKGKLVAAICAAPLLLKAAGLLDGKRVSAHSCAWDEIPAARNCPPVESDGNILTSRGPGTAFDFGLAFVEKLFGSATAEKICVETMK